MQIFGLNYASFYIPYVFFYIKCPSYKHLNGSTHFKFVFLKPNILILKKIKKLFDTLNLQKNT